MEQADSFIAVVEKRKMFIRSQLSADYDKQVLENAKAIIDVIQFLTKQGLALRVYHWNKVTRREDGNFRACKISSKYSHHTATAPQPSRGVLQL